MYQYMMNYNGDVFVGVNTISVAIEGSKGGLLGENGTEIRCVYTLGDIIYVSFSTFNKSSLTFEIIATYRPDRTPQLNTHGHHLNGRVTLTQITQSSTKAVMTFNKLMCIDDTFYRCQVIYFGSSGTQIITSNNISISVQGSYYDVIGIL